MSSSPSINEIFGHGSEEFAAIASRIQVELNTKVIRYKFVPMEEFERLLVFDTPRALHVYWHELVGRAHFAAVSSMLRSAQWLEGVRMAREKNLYLPFCANLRSLIESAADSLAGVSGVAKTFSEKRVAINEILNMNSKQAMISQELEDQLIHFSHGRKLGKGETAPESHVARSARSYIEQLEKLGLAQAHDIYGLLCQVTHPAADSVSHFASEIGDSEFALSPHNDRAAIAALLREHKTFLSALLRYAFNQPIILLRVLLHIDLHEYHSTEVSRLNMSSMPGWQKCATLMGIAH